MKKSLVLLAGLWSLFAAATVQAQGTWSTSDLYGIDSIAGEGGCAAAAGDKVYICDGWNHGQRTSAVLVFDTLNNNNRSWLRLPSGHYPLDICASNGKIYFVVYGGDLDIYDTYTQSWETQTLPTGVGRCRVCASADGAVLVQSESLVQIYDSVNHNWTTKSLAEPRYFLGAVACGTQVLFAGGYNDNAGRTTSLVDIYDTVSRQWSTAALSQARSTLAATSAGNLVFFGGGGTGTTRSNVVDIYDTVANTWSTAFLSQARASLTATSVGNYVLFAGGNAYPSADGTGTSNVVDIFDTVAGTWNTASLSQGRWRLVSASANDEAFFAGGYDFYTVDSPSSKVDILTIPEPATLSLLALGGAAVIARRRKRRFTRA